MAAPARDAPDLDHQLRAACAELEARLRTGAPCSAEDCLARYSQLAADSDRALELIYFEYVLREELGQAPAPEDWYRRFPAEQTVLAKIFAIHHTKPRESLSALATLFIGPTASERPVALRRPSKYELLEELGRGSMGVVYKAREPALDRIVALKLILAGPHAGRDQLLRVHREARAVARLQHPNIVQIHEIGQDDDRPFLCMEYVNGPSLDRLLNQWREQGRLGLTPHDAARLLESIAGAVHYAHLQGIIHRDLKPANILLARGEGRGARGESDPSPLVPHLSSLLPKIADFGLAKFLDGSGDATQSGYVLGTPAYMAPEQAFGRHGDVGPAADVYALGVILYELLAGRVPFQAPAVQETLELMRTAEPAPPRQLQPNLPRDLETICLKCLAKEPAIRYPSARALAEDLRHFLAGEPIVARPATHRERAVKWVRRRPVIAGLLAALVLAVAAGGSGVVWQWQRAEQNAAEAESHAQDLQRERDKAIEERVRAEHHLKRARDSIAELAKLGDTLRLTPQTNRTGKVVIEKVLAFYQELLKDESKDPVVRLGTAHVCGQVAHLRHTLGQMDKAVEARQQEASLLEQLLKEDPNNMLYRLDLSMSLRGRAHVLRDMGKTQEARTAYREAAELGEQVLATAPDNPQYQAALANTLMNAATVLSSAEHAQPMESLYLRAIELIKSAQKTVPTHRDYPAELALCLEALGSLYWDRGQGEKAEKSMRAGIAIRDDIYRRGRRDRWIERYRGRAYSELAMIVAGRGRSAEAEQLYNRAVELLTRLLAAFPDDMPCRSDLVGARLGQGLLQAKLGNHRKAVEHCRQAVQLDPKHSLAHNNLAWYLATCPEPGLRDVPEAVRLAKKAVALAPQAYDPWNTLGVAQYRAGDCKAAIASLTKSMELHAGGDCNDWFFLAMAHEKLGDHAAARRWLAKGVVWLRTHGGQNEELQRFQAEAQALVGGQGAPLPTAP